QSSDFLLPRGIGGTAAKPINFYVYIVTDPSGLTGGATVPIPVVDVLGAFSALYNDASYGYFTSHRYEDSANNPHSAPLPVIYKEPDLKVTNVVVPITQLHSGDTFPVTFTVTNVGNRDTREGYWVDRVFLSRDPSLDVDPELSINDIELGQAAHTTILKAD